MPLDVLTRSYNNERTGVNLQETTLKKANVNVNTFGRLFARTVDGQIFAQPLIVTGITINAQVEPEVVIVATTRNFVYAFDAKDPARCDPLWRSTQLGTPVANTDFNVVPGFPSIPGSPPVQAIARPYRDFTEEIGIVSTPVIDAAKKIIYLVAKSKANGQYFNKLHKLDLSTGLDVPGSPVTISGKVNGHGYGSVGGSIQFDPKWQMARPGLLLAGGNVYMAFGSQGDAGPFHGWVFSYNATTLQPAATPHCSTPNWGEGGIWQSGSGLAYDGQHVYYVAGNGPAADTIGRRPTQGELSASPGFGNTIVKLDANTLQVVDWFSPTNTQDLSEDDLDFCSGPVLPTGTNLVLGFDKLGFIYSCDRNAMGKWQPGGNANAQSQKITQFNVHGTPLYWPANKRLFLWSEQDACLAYQLNGNQFTFFPGGFSRFRFQPGVQQMPGGMLALSANGTQDGIVWGAHPTSKNANLATVAGTLRAFDADNLQNELWNSDHDPHGTDAVGNFAKFCPPVVANGKVYLATFSRELVVYGLLASLPGSLPGQDLAPWKQASIGTGVTGSAFESCNRLTILGSGRDIWDASDAFHFVFQAAPGAHVSLTARVTSVQRTDPWAKAGVMIRDTQDPASVHAMVVVTPDNGIAFQQRVAAGGGSATMTIPGIKAPHWVRIVREPIAGQPGKFQFSGFHSADGINWLIIGQVTIGMGGGASAGLAVCAHTVTANDPNSIIGLEELNISTFAHVDLQ